MNWCRDELNWKLKYLFKFAANCHVGSCLVLAKPQNSLPSNSLINFPAIVSHDYSVISLALNNIFCPKKLSIRRVYLAVASQNERQQWCLSTKPPIFFPVWTTILKTINIHQQRSPLVVRSRFLGGGRAGDGMGWGLGNSERGLKWGDGGPLRNLSINILK